MDELLPEARSLAVRLVRREPSLGESARWVTIFLFYLFFIFLFFFQSCWLSDVIV